MAKKLYLYEVNFRIPFMAEERDISNDLHRLDLEKLGAEFLREEISSNGTVGADFERLTEMTDIGQVNENWHSSFVWGDDSDDLLEELISKQ